MTHVVIPAFDTPLSYVASASQTAFAITFPFWASADIVVALNGDVLDPAAYVITGSQLQDGSPVTGAYGSGTMTLNTPCAGGEVVIIERLINPVRQTDLSPVGPLDINQINSDLDKLTARDQDVIRLIDRAVLAPVGESGYLLPANDDLKGKWLYVDTSGNIVGTDSVPDLVNVIGATVDMLQAQLLNVAYLQVTNADHSGHAGLLIEQYNTDAGAYAGESHVYPGANGWVLHHYSDLNTPLKIDNVGNQSVITLNNTENPAVRPGVKGNGVFITFGGYFATTGAWGTANTHGILAILGPTLQFASYDAGMQFEFSTGLLCVAGALDPNRALAVTAYNSGYAQTITGTDSGLYITTSTNGGQTFAIDKTGTGAGVVGLIVNRGTGNTIEFSNGTTTGLIINKDQHLGIGTAPGAYALAVSQAANQVYVASTGANDCTLTLDNAAGGHAVQLNFYDGAVLKWRWQKKSDNTMALTDNVNTIDLISTTITGGITIGAASQEVAFFGGTPASKPTLAAVATDAATTLTLANSIRTALIGLTLAA